MSKALEFSLKIPCSAEYIGVVRLAISGIASRMNFNVEEIEDIKISVSEACTNVIQHAYGETDPYTQNIEMTVHTSDEEIEITVQDFGQGFDLKELGTEEQQERSREKLGLGLGLTFIKSLMDTTDFNSEAGKGTTIRMTKKAPKLISTEMA